MNAAVSARLLPALVILVAMIAAAGMAGVLRPTVRLANTMQSIQLDSAIPIAFGNWIVDEGIVPLPPAPDVERRIDMYYSQTISRTYRDRSSGERVMLSIAYGVEQSRQLQVHRPEVCYTSQGFTLGGLSKVSLILPGTQPIPAMRLVGTQGTRVEAITYWIRFGHDIVRGNLEQGFSRLRHGLRGEIPDALLFRVSTLSPGPDEAYQAQDRFVGDLLAAINQDARQFLIGQP